MSTSVIKGYRVDSKKKWDKEYQYYHKLFYHINTNRTTTIEDGEYCQNQKFLGCQHTFPDGMESEYWQAPNKNMNQKTLLIHSYREYVFVPD